MPDVWLDPDPRYPDDAMLVGERAVLTGYLRHYRMTVELKCAGLDAEQLARRSVPPSTLSLLGCRVTLRDVRRLCGRGTAQPD